MTIKEVETYTGLKRSVIRFYEQEKLIQPARNSQNGYREYSPKDVEMLQKIAYLRTLDLSLEEITRISKHQTTLKAAIKKQNDKLDSQMQELQQAKLFCTLMMQDEMLDFENLDIGKYVNDKKHYWLEHREKLKMDSAKFIDLWGGLLIWGILTICCLLIAIGTFWLLPEQIPIQWSQGKAVQNVNRLFIFIYPISCVIIRLILKPFIWRWLYTHNIHKESVVSYLTNFLCFIALSIETFTVLFVYGTVSDVRIVILVDAIVFLGMLLVGGKENM